MRVATPPLTTTPSLGVSLSPGGLLLPYHLGVLDGLQHCGVLTKSTPIAGASAGAIAAASRACELDSKVVLDATIDISDTTGAMGGARGRLLAPLRQKLDEMIDEEQYLKACEKPLAIAYKQLYPRFENVHQTTFESEQDLKNAVCHSSMFPFFTTNWPVTWCGDTNRLLVDGFFAVPRSRFGCPDFQLADGLSDAVDETIMVCPFPAQYIGLQHPECNTKWCISPDPDEDFSSQIERLLRLATQSTSAPELIGVYDSGFEDAEKWYHNIYQKHQQEQRQQEADVVTSVDPDGRYLALN